MALRTAFAPSRAPLGLHLASTRSFTCLSIPGSSAHLRGRKENTLPRPIFQHSFRRAYADAPTAQLSPTPKPKKRFRFLRWTWRITYLSAIGGVAYLSYLVYDLKNPSEQFEPDPSKKTLVILGRRTDLGSSLSTNTCRDWMGSGFSTQETRYRKLQRRSHLAAKFLPIHPSTSLLYHWYDRTSLHHGAYPKHSSA